MPKLALALAKNLSPKEETETSAGGAAGETDDSDQSAGDETAVQLGGGPTPSHQKVSDQEGGRIPLQETSEVSAPEGGITERDDDYEGSGYTGAAADIERLLNRIAEDSVTTDLERQRTEELTELAQSISYGDIHDGVKQDGTLGLLLSAMT